MNKKRIVGLSFVIFICLFLLNTLNVQAKNEKIYTSKRLSGQTRYETSINIAEQLKESKFKNVVITNGNSFTDALTGSVLAKKLRAPILLVDSNTENSSSVIDYINNNLEKNGSVYILGGTGVISEDFVSVFKNLGFNNIHRLGGKDRFETNKLICDELDKSKNIPVVIVNGFNFPDTLSISSIAAYNGYPILLNDKDSLSSSTRLLIDNIKPNKIFMIGGTGALSNNITNEIKSIIPTLNDEDIVRIGGSNRYETSLNICKYFNLNNKSTFIASGENFPDALSGSALAAKLGSPIILVDDKNDDIQKEYLDNIPHEEEIILGGIGAISKGLEKESIKSPTIVSISNLTNCDFKVEQGDGYCTAPYDSATSLMSDGTYKELPINWFPSNPNKLNKSKLGTYTFVATVDGFEEKYIVTITIKASIKHTAQLMCSSVQGENIFYVLDNTLYMSNPKETTTITSGTITKIIPHDNWVYYLDNKDLFKIKLDGTYKTKI